MTNKALSYSLKVWLTSAIVTPMLFTIGGLLFSDKGHPQEPIGDYIGFTLAFILFGMAYSILLFVPVWLLISKLIKLAMPERKLKLLVLMVAELLIATLIFGLQLKGTGVIGLNTLVWWLPYALVTGLAIWFYKLEPSEKPIESVRSAS
jgi:hypothetical protein